METEVIYNSDLHFEHVHWSKELAFWKDELKSFNNRLSELVLRWTDNNILLQLEQFQNQFIRHRQVIDSLKDGIHTHEINMSKHFKKGEDVMDQVFVHKHMEYREHMEVQRHLYTNLKKDFFKFLSKNMHPLFLE